MSQNEINSDALLKKYRNKALFDTSLLEALSYGRQEIKKIIPHRPPFLLIDDIKAVNIDQGCIMGSRFLDENDPVFTGHFPQSAVYPGVLGIEMIGQLGLCLHYFLKHKSTKIVEDSPLAIRATKVKGALFLSPMLPNKTLEITCQLLDFDGYFASVIGQIKDGNTVCCNAIGEVVFLD